MDKLLNIDNSKTSWRVRVRLTRIWQTLSTTGTANRLHNLILLDTDDFPVHAMVTPDIWNSFDPPPREGDLYEIFNFYSRPAAGVLRPVKSSMCIIFTRSTTIQRILEDDSTIPKNKFSFVHLRDLYDICRSQDLSVSIPVHTIDVIGVVEDPGEVIVIPTRIGERVVHRFQITDGIHSLKIAVLGQHILASNALFNQHLERPVVVILASCRLNELYRSCSLSTIDCSKIYINLDNHDVLDIRERYAESGDA